MSKNVVNKTNEDVYVCQFSHIFFNIFERVSTYEMRRSLLESLIFTLFFFSFFFFFFHSCMVHCLTTLSDVIPKSNYIPFLFYCTNAKSSFGYAVWQVHRLPQILLLLLFIVLNLIRFS